MTELQEWQLHPYQARAISHMVQHPRSFLWMGLGLGKSIVTLTAIKHLKQHQIIRAALVIGPLRVAQSVWAQEVNKWAHTKGLRVSLILGNTQERMRGLSRPADVYVTNYENVKWLSEVLHHYYINRGTLLPFDMLVLDESPKMKNWNSKRYISLLPIVKYFKYRTGLTGTPASNGMEDLWAQFMLVDDGQRLGQSPDLYLHDYFTKAGGNGYRYKVTDEGRDYIHKVVSDIVMEMKTEDYITLPDFIVNDIYVELPPKARVQYDEVEMLLFTELDNGVELEVTAPSAKGNKLLQMANGAAFTNTELREWHPVHDAKLDALEEILDESGGSPVLVAYNYKPDAARIKKRFPYAVDLTGLSMDDFNRVKDEWRAGDIRLLLAHPASTGHGVDGLQGGGHTLVWFGLNWSLELTLQFNGRLHRQGQEHPVMCHRILANNTMDQAVNIALSMKENTQSDLRDAVRLYRQQRGM